MVGLTQSEEGVMAFSQINNKMQLKLCFSCPACRANTTTQCSGFVELLVTTLSVTPLPALLHPSYRPLSLSWLRMSGWSGVIVSPLALILGKASGFLYEGVT